MSQHQEGPRVPGFDPNAPGQPVSVDDIGAQRVEQYLEGASEDARKRDMERELIEGEWAAMRERQYLAVTAQLPKVLMAAALGAVLAFLIPLGVDR